MLKKTNAFIMILSLIFILGCAEVDVPKPEDVLKHPLGTESIKIGMSKDRVMNLWGEPDRVEYSEIKESGSKRPREIWIYQGRYSSVPLDAGYLSKTKYLYFDGNSLTKISEESQKD